MAFTQHPEAYCGLWSLYYTVHTCVTRGHISSVQRLDATRLEDSELTEGNVRDAERKQNRGPWAPSAPVDLRGLPRASHVLCARGGTERALGQMSGN